MATQNPDPAMPRPPSGLVSPRGGMRSRTQSISSDRPSTIALSLMSPPTSVSPEAAFIAASAASQIVTNDHETHADTWFDEHGIEPAGETALVSPDALLLVNNFLDQLLFNFLSVSRATTLSALRPAVAEVLKPKLAKDAVNNADEELREYLGEGDEEDYVQPQGADPSRDWDLELVWKRTRLRCMVYSSLGDMEEEDEDHYMEQENLEVGVNEQVSNVISPAVAIFLTSVLEYMGELTLTVAGQAAYHRLRTKFQREISEGTKTPTDIVDRIVVEDVDMERVALDRTLGRLWRGWKKRIRSPVIDLNGRSFSRSSHGHLRHDSNMSDSPVLSRSCTHSSDTEKQNGATIAEHVQPSDIALPIGDRDVDEIEVPGLAAYSDDEDEKEADAEPSQRPKSIADFPMPVGLGITTGLLTPTLPLPDTTIMSGRKRSSSLTISSASPFTLRALSEVPLPGEKAAAEDETEIEEAQSDNAKTVEGEIPEEETPKEATAKEEIPQQEVVRQQIPKVEAASNVETMDNIPPDVRPEDAALVGGSKAKAQGLTKLNTTASSNQAKPIRKRLNTEEKEEAATYERAEIVTTSRVSVAGSSSPALSDSGGPSRMRRSSSVHSARIIDVYGPKSPNGSRSPSVDTNGERIRPVSMSLSQSGGHSPRVPIEEPPMPKILSNVSRSGVPSSKSRSPVDRMRGSISNAATISESEEETASESTDDRRGKNGTAAAGFQPSPLTSSVSDELPVARRRPQQSSLPSSPHQVLSNHRQTPSGGTKVTILRSPGMTTPVPEDRAMDLPRRAPGHSGRTNEKTPTSPSNSIGVVSIERSKNKEAEEEATTPVQSGHPNRAIHTSGSSGSSVAARLKAVRTSEENAQSRSENVARNFEELIQSNQTITYTLTPENMRDIDHSVDGPVVTKTAPKAEEPRGHVRTPSAAADTKKNAPLPRAPAEEPVSGHTPKGSIGKGPKLSAAPREARIPSESTADFAAFIKATGPTKDNGPTPLRSVNNPPTPTKSSMETARRASATASRNRYMPREPASDSRGGNSDLIDFLRQGPPGASVNRPPRATPADEAAGGRSADAAVPDIRYSQASTHATDTSMPSIHSSVNSHTALLKNKGSAPPANNRMFDDEDMMPKRKTRRVKDPYAIDFSDEEDDDDPLQPPKPPPKREESLAEFLRNYDPPPEPAAPPVANNKVPKKKASAPSLMGRFGRNNSHATNGGTTQLAPVADSRSLSSRNGAKGYIPIQVNIPAGYDKYGAIDKPTPPLPSGASGGPRVPMKKFEPREAVSNVSRTSDLANFLRNSEPPPDMMAAPASPPMRAEESGGISKMFGRRKKL